MRPLWSGSINFGLVNIPVRLYTATQERRLDFDYLRKKDLCRVRYKRVCETSGEEVPYHEMVRGFQVTKGNYVVLTEQDFKRADVKKTSLIEIMDFVKESDVDSKFFEKPYLIEPAKGADKSYALLREALVRSGKVGVARYVLRNQESLGIIKVEDSVIILNQIRFSAELRPAKSLEIPKKEKLEEREVSLALNLIDHLTTKFDPEKYKDTYTNTLKKIIKQKSAGKKFKVVKEARPQPTHVTELMDRLRASLEDAKKHGRAVSTVSN